MPNRVHGLKRVSIIDFDVHHGNGTNDAFYDDPNIFNYPGTCKIDELGHGDGEGTFLNLPLQRGSGDIAISTVFEEVIVPSAQRFKPDIFLASAGYDGPICGGRCVFFLEGGYNLDSVSYSVAGYFHAFIGEKSLASEFDNPAIN
uniref:Histone deacetylase domain-containing protein n=1 Tax=Populus trichocarpa TaxID=3694 RepID=A0A2K1ZSE7_POPTR